MLVFIMLGIISVWSGLYIKEIITIFMGKEQKKSQEERTQNIKKLVIKSLLVVIVGSLLITTIKSPSNGKPIKSTPSSSVLSSNLKFSSPKAEESYKRLLEIINHNQADNETAINDLLNCIDTMRRTLETNEIEEVIKSIFDNISLQNKFLISVGVSLAELNQNISGERMLYMAQTGYRQLSDEEIRSTQYGSKMTLIAHHLFPNTTDAQVGKLSALGKIIYDTDGPIREYFRNESQKIIKDVESRVAKKIDDFYEGLDNKSEREQFYFCSGFSIATLDVENPAVLTNKTTGMPTDYASLMLIYKNPETVQIIMRENQNQFKRTQEYIKNETKSRASQYLGWGVTQYGHLTDAELDMFNIGRLTAYFNKTIRRDKNVISKCKKVLNDKMAGQSAEVLEAKGSPYIYRLLKKSHQKDLRHYVITPDTQLSVINVQPSSYINLETTGETYKKSDNIPLTFKWKEKNANCDELETKVKEILSKNNFEIVENGLSCSKDTKISEVKLSVQAKSLKLGKVSIPSIELYDIFSNSIDFIVNDSENLIQALQSKDVNAIKSSLSSPTDLNEIKIDGEHPVAHFIKDDMTFAQELIKLGASADVIDKNGYTPLMYAVIRQDNDFLDLLLNKKVYLNEVDKKGRTAIMYAAIKNNLYAAKKLIEHRADIYKSKDDKWTAYKYAKEMKHTEIAELLKSNKDQIVLLIDNCDACRAKEKIFHKLAKNYPSFPRSSVITTTPDNDKNSKEHNWNIKFPFVKIGDSKTLDGDVMSAFRSGHRLDNWDGTEKQLETIMYKD